MNIQEEHTASIWGTCTEKDKQTRMNQYRSFRLEAFTIHF